MAANENKQDLSEEFENDLKQRIKKYEGTAASRGVVNSLEGRENEPIPRLNIKLSDSNYGAYIDVVSLLNKNYGEGGKYADLPERQKMAQYNIDRQAIQDVIDAKNDPNQEGLSEALETLYARNGNVTVGYGHLLENPTELADNFDTYNTYTEEQANSTFDKDYTEHKEGIANRLTGYKDAPEEVKGVLIDLAFNMGTNFTKKFKNFAKAINSKDYEEARKQLEYVDPHVENPVKSGYAGGPEDRVNTNLTALSDAANKPEVEYPEDDFGMKYDTPARMRSRPKVTPVEPKAPVEKPAPAPAPAPVSQKAQEEKPKKAQPSSGDSPKDYSDYPFKEAFDMAKNRDKQKIFYWEGRPFTTVTADELLAKSSKPTPAVEDKPAKEGKVEDYLDKAPEPLAEYKPAPGDMLGGELFSMLPRYPVPDIMDKKEPVKKSKVSDILKKTTEPDYDKMSFEEAFKAKRAKGEKEFPWRGKTYTTKYKEEM